MELSIFVLCCAGFCINSLTASPVHNNADFTVALAKIISKKNPHENFLFSPVSLEMLFAIVMGGTAGKTEQQIQERIFNCPASDRYTINYYVESLLKAAKTYTTETTTLRYATILALDQSFPVKDRFIARIERNFPDAKFLHSDFSVNGDKDTAEINRIVAQTTENHIKDLLPEGSLNDQVAMLLANALYLKESFLQGFVSMKKGRFHVSKSEAVENVEFLKHTFDDIPYYRNDKFSMIILPFQNENFGFHVAMPEGNVRTVDILDTIRENFQPNAIKFEFRNVDVEIPKFTMEYTVRDLVRNIKHLNVTDIFDLSSVDFSRLLQHPTQKVTVSDIQHKAFIEVNEDGVEAAAGSSMSLQNRFGGSSYDDEFHADRPFIFFITMKHGAVRQFESVVFVGQYNKPPQM